MTQRFTALIVGWRGRRPPIGGPRVPLLVRSIVGHTGSGSDRRQICDGPKQADGSWQRTRTVYTPGHAVPLSCSSSSWGLLTCSGGNVVPETTRTQESYPVTAETVLPDEPGWLPPGTDDIF